MAVSRFDELQAADVAAIFEDVGNAATFTPETGDPVSLYVIVEKELALQPDGFRAQAADAYTLIKYALADIGRQANRGETFVISSGPLTGNTYEVQSIVDDDGLIVEARVVTQ